MQLLSFLDTTVNMQARQRAIAEGRVESTSIFETGIISWDEESQAVQVRLPMLQCMLVHFLEGCPSSCWYPVRFKVAGLHCMLA
jgi:hypothetical protein